jgi:uncharacterized protein
VKLPRVMVFVLAIAVFMAPFAGPSAYAQDSASPSILEFFGLKPAKPKLATKKQSQRISATKKAKLKKRAIGRKKISAKAKTSQILQHSLQGLEASPVDAGLPAIPDKLPDAKVILVVGDFMADGVSEGIAQAFEGDAGVTVTSRANGSSGFIRDDFYNWPVEIAGIVAETKPAVITVMIGTNDRQALRLNGNKAVVRSPEWTTDYERRVAAFADALKVTGVPVVWIGVPPFKQPTTSADMLALNDIYRKNAERVSGTFVDIWEGFLDEQGLFNINGSDYIGQPARLRASDGINLTFPGKRKAAFFAEKPLRLALGKIGAVGASAFNPFNLPGPKPAVSIKPVKITHVPPVSLFDPAFDGDTELLGSAISAQKTSEGVSSAQALYVNGNAPKPMAGRVDEVNIAPQEPAFVPAQVNASAP